MGEIPANQPPVAHKIGQRPGSIAYRAARRAPRIWRRDGTAICSMNPQPSDHRVETLQFLVGGHIFARTPLIETPTARDSAQALHHHRNLARRQVTALTNSTPPAKRSLAATKNPNSTGCPYSLHTLAIPTSATVRSLSASHTAHPSVSAANPTLSTRYMHCCGAGQFGNDTATPSSADSTSHLFRGA